MLCHLSIGLVIQDQSSLNSLDTTVLHKDEQPKKEIGPYFGFGVSAAEKHSNLSVVLIFGLFLHFLSNFGFC